MKKIKFYHKSATATRADGTKSVVTVVGKFTQEREIVVIQRPTRVETYNNHFKDGYVTYEEKALHRTLTVGVSICHNSDSFNEEYGIERAKKKIEKGYDAGTIETNSVTMLTKDLIDAELTAKLKYICANIDSYTKKINGKRRKL